MTMQSKFQGVLGKLKLVDTGKKVSNDTTPVLTVLGIPNKFQISRLAAIMMDLQVGGRIRLFPNPENEGNNDRFFIAKAANDDAGAAKLAKASSANPATSGIDMVFNYSGFWSQMIQDEIDSVELGMDALVEKGVAYKGETATGKERYRSARAVKYEIEHVGPVTLGEEGSEQTFDIYALVNRKVKAKTSEEIQQEKEAIAKTAEKLAKEASEKVGESSEDDDEVTEIDFEEEASEDAEE